MRGVIDAATETGVQEIVIIAGTQVGKTTALENMLGYWVDNDPGPALIVKPTEADIGEYIKERIRPLLDSSLSQHVLADRADNTLRSIKLDTMPMYFGWAGSPGSLASRPCRYILLDEVDKFPPFAGREADPVSLAKERTATFLHRRRIVMTSTPTTRDGAIWQAWEGCGDRRHYYVPCPHCQEMQRLVWGQVKWPRLQIEDPIKRGDEIERNGLAWYECIACKGRIEESHKPKMLERGAWRGDGSKSPRVGFHLNSLYSPWRSFAAMAAEFIRAENDIGATMNFRNSRLAEPFENVAKSFQPSIIRERIPGSPTKGIVPDWAQAIFATVDTQKDWFKLHIRAWAGGYRSQLILEAVCASFDEVYRVAFESVYPMATGAKAAVHAMLIDSGGNRTDEVYQFSLRDPRIKPTKGASHSMRRPWTLTNLPSGVQLYMIDTEFFKDMLSRLISDPDQSKWAVHNEVTEQYIAEMASEHKVVNRTTGKLMWLKKSQGLRGEAWDCEVLQCAAADMANLGALPMRPVERAAPQSQVQSISPSDWLNRHR